MISRAVSGLGDAALLLPASALLVAYLAALGRVRLAASLAAALALGGGATIAAKLLFQACGHAIAPIDVVSPSGHASFATLFYGALALLLGSGRSRQVAWALAGTVTLLVIAIGISRVRTGAHSPAEVAIGAAIGLGALAIFSLLHARQERAVMPWRPIAIGFGLAVMLLGGLHFSLEGTIGKAARRISATLDVCGPSERLRATSLLPFPR